MSQHGCPERLSNRSKGFQEDGQSQPTMEVLVETLTGTAFEMTVSPSDTIFAIKSKIFRVEGIPVSQQHLLYNLKELEDSSSLREHSIGDGARLRLVLGMCGGPITTRRLPPPPSAEPWRDIERLLDSNRDEGEWGSSGCKVTLLVFREGERVNMLRVRENRDGSFTPLDHNKFEVCAGAAGASAAATASAGAEAEAPLGALLHDDDGLAGALHENAVTMGKMLELRRRMENLSLQRRGPRPGDKPEIQKTRSEETLSISSLLDEATVEQFKAYVPYSEAEDTFAPLYDGNYTRYDYDCSFADRYSLLPPIGTRTDSEPSVQEAGDSERLSALAGSILVKGRDDEAAILEECLEGTVEDCRLRQDSPQLAAKNLAPIPAAEYGPLVGGAAGGWRAAGFGSAGGLAGGLTGGLAGGLAGSLAAPLAPLTPRAAHHSASALHVRAPRRPAPLSSSTPDLEQLARHRILPALSRHRNREHLHLSDDGLDAPRRLEVGSERRQRRIQRIAEIDACLAAAAVQSAVSHVAVAPPPPAPAPEPAKEGARRLRCQLCRRRLSIATVHVCRCGGRYCAPHRYAELHACAYDYKQAPRHN